MKIFITGANGFIGRHLVHRLIKTNHKLTILVRSSAELTVKSGPKLKIVIGDINKLPPSIKKTINSNDVLIHLAAIRANWGSHEDFYQTNSQSIKGLISKKTKIKHVIATSSVYVHGVLHSLPADEEAPLNAKDTYGKTKIALEDAVKDICVKQNINYTIIRPAIVYGTGDNSSGMLMKLISLLKSGKFVYIGKGENLIHLIHVNDLVHGYIRAIQTDPSNQIYILAGGQPIKLSKLVSHIQYSLKLGYSVKRLPRAPIYFLSFIVQLFFSILDKIAPDLISVEPPLLPIKVEVISNDWHYDISKARKYLKFRPTVSYKTGITQLAKWYLKSYKNTDML